MLEELFNNLYDKFKIKFYQNIFKKFENRSPSLNVLELLLFVFQLNA